MALHQSHAAHSWEQVPSKCTLCWSGLWPLPDDGCFNWVLSRHVLALMLFPPHMVHQGLNNQETKQCCLKKITGEGHRPPIPCLARATPALFTPKGTAVKPPAFKQQHTGSLRGLSETWKGFEGHHVTPSFVLQNRNVTQLYQVSLSSKHTPTSERKD